MEWFFAEPRIKEEPVEAVIEHWMCPKNCGGEMIYTGSMWPSGEPGYHHKCNNDNCRHMAAISGKQYPRLTLNSNSDFTSVLTPNNKE